jgi:hypothetical protein
VGEVVVTPSKACQLAWAHADEQAESERRTKRLVLTGVEEHPVSRGVNERRGH